MANELSEIVKYFPIVMATNSGYKLDTKNIIGGVVVAAFSALASSYITIYVTTDRLSYQMQLMTETMKTVTSKIESLERADDSIRQDIVRNKAIIDSELHRRNDK